MTNALFQRITVEESKGIQWVKKNGIFPSVKLHQISTSVLQNSALSLIFPF